MIIYALEATSASAGGQAVGSRDVILQRFGVRHLGLDQ